MDRSCKRSDILELARCSVSIPFRKDASYLLTSDTKMDPRGQHEFWAIAHDG